MATTPSPDNSSDLSGARRDLHEKASEKASEEAARIDRVDGTNGLTPAEANAAANEAAAESASRVAAEEEAIRADSLARRASAQASVAAAERRVADNELRVERRRASNYTFGFLMTAGILAAALLVGLLYTLFRPRAADQVVVNAGTLPPGQTTTTVTNQPAPPPPVYTPSGTTVAPPPPPVIVPHPGPVTVTSTRPGGTPLRRVIVRVPAASAAIFTSNPAAYLGKRLTFDVVNVESVIADRAFWVGPSTGERLLAVLDPALDNGAMERIVVVKPGQTRTMSGTLHRMPPVETARRRWKLDDGDVFDIQGQRYYVLIDRIDLR
jgi:hypothetical protein